jgi:hypothetical protein
MVILLRTTFLTLERFATMGPFSPQQNVLKYDQTDIIITRKHPHIVRGTYWMVFKGSVKGIAQEVVIKDDGDSGPDLSRRVAARSSDHGVWLSLRFSLLFFFAFFLLFLPLFERLHSFQFIDLYVF